jgi:hypothetical protein
VTFAYNALSQRTQIARYQSTGTTNAVATTNEMKCYPRMALYTCRNLFHSKELSPLQSLCRILFRGSIISWY